jgi:hypothetical protein
MLVGLGDKWLKNLIVYTPESDQSELMKRLVKEKDGRSEKILLP